MRSYLLFIAIFFAVSTTAQDKVISFTLEDLPGQSHSRLKKIDEVNYFQQMLNLFDKHDIECTGFVIGDYAEKYDIALLSKFVANGHRVGIQSNRPLSLNNSDAGTFIEDVEQAHERLNSYLYKRRMYRFPKLHYGNSLAKQDSVFNYLEKHDYEVVPASIYLDNRQSSLAYISLKNSDVEYLRDSIIREFKNNVLSKCEEAFVHSRKKVNRDIRQIISLPYNPLTVIGLGEILPELRARGWRFSTVDSAMIDKIYQFHYYQVSETTVTVLDKFNHKEDLEPVKNAFSANQPLQRGIPNMRRKYALEDFLSYHPDLELEVSEYFDNLSTKQMAGQMIVQALGKYGKEYAEIAQLVAEGKLGGVLLLNGSVQEFKADVYNLDDIVAMNEQIPLLFTADAEPSLMNRKLKGSTKVVSTDKINSESKSRMVATTISEQLNDIGVNQNYAPVCDLSNSNKAMNGNRSFGSDPREVSELSAAFILETQQNGIAATAKHFPGHGRVQGDSHEKLVYIDGELEELEVYKPLIDAGVVSIMVGHIAIRNNKLYNTEGMPASCSKNVITDLLKGEMGFAGLVISDAMNMGALSGIRNASFRAIEAGCDMVIMPEDEDKLISSIVEKMALDEGFRQQVYSSVRKVIRLKICLGLL